MPLNFKSTRHLPIVPRMQAKSTEETLVLPGRQSYGQLHKLGWLPLSSASGYLMEDHVRLDCSQNGSFLNFSVPGRRKAEVRSPPAAEPGLGMRHDAERPD